MGASASTPSPTAPHPTTLTPRMLRPVRIQMKASAISQRASGVMPGSQCPRYWVKSAGYTAMSMKLSTQLHQPTWNAQNGPKARLTQVTYPPSSGSDEESSAMTSVTGRLQTRGVRISSRRARPGPKRLEEHTSELQSRLHLVCPLPLEKKK